MGRIKNNVVTKGFSGKFGDDLVFRQVDSKTVFARKSEITNPPSAKQASVRNKFSDAAYYASAAMDNPVAYEEYKQIAELEGLKSAYIAAVTDYLTMPQIGKVFTVLYTGKVGDMIHISSKSPYKITEIEISIIAPNGTVLESGKAEQHSLKYRYTTTVANPTVPGTKIVLKHATASIKNITLR